MLGSIPGEVLPTIWLMIYDWLFLIGWVLDERTIVTIVETTTTDASRIRMLMFVLSNQTTANRSVTGFALGSYNQMHFAHIPFSQLCQLVFLVCCVEVLADSGPLE